MAELEIKKSRQGSMYSPKAKVIVLNVLKYLRAQSPNKSLTQIIRQTAYATGCSEKSIFTFHKEASNGGLQQPSKQRAVKQVPCNSREIKYNESVRQVIRDIVYEEQQLSTGTSLRKIMKRVTVERRIPIFSLNTLRRLLGDMGFYFKKIGKKVVLVVVKSVDDKDQDLHQNSPKNIYQSELGIYSLNTHKQATDYSENTTNPSEINIDTTAHANCKQATDYSENTTNPSEINIDRTTHANWEYANLKCNIYVRQAITDVIHFLQKRDITPSLTNIMEQLKPDSEIPKFSLTVLHWLIYDMGFHYKQNGNKVVLIKESVDAVDTKDYKEFKVSETQFREMSYSNLCKQEPAFLKEEPVFVKPEPVYVKPEPVFVKQESVSLKEEPFSSEVDQLCSQGVIHSVSLVYTNVAASRIMYSRQNRDLKRLENG